MKLGGAESMLADMAREQSRSVETAIVVINDEYEGSVMNGIGGTTEVVRIGRPVSSRNPWYPVKLRLALRRLKPDIIHAHAEHIVRLLPFLRMPTVLTVHMTGIRLAPSICRYRKLFAISEAVKQDVVSRVSGLDITVIHDGIDFGAIRQKESYGGSPFRIVQVGRLDHVLKGQDMLVRAVRLVTDRLGEDSVTVDFIGEGGSLTFLRELARDLRVDRWCAFPGLRPRRDLYDSLHGYDMLAQPSRSEGFGLTIVEAMAAGLPVLVSDTRGPMEVIDHGNNGFFFSVEDHVDCAERIMEVLALSHRPDMHARMDEARSYAMGRFSIAATAEKYIREYEKVVSAGG
jgi:glycosyltransferase involved in cell wall biosynthesis